MVYSLILLKEQSVLYIYMNVYNVKYKNKNNIINNILKILLNLKYIKIFNYFSGSTRTKYIT